jgi:hypothetical protein
MRIKGDLENVVVKWSSDIRKEIITGMLSYDKSGMPERDPFTKVVFQWLKLSVGYRSNPKGSFPANRAADVLNDEGGYYVEPHNLTFGYNVRDFFERLENGTVDFSWIWDTFLEDAVNEKWFEKMWKNKLGDVNWKILKKGPPGKTEERPYVGNVMEKHKGNYADAIHDSIQETIKKAGHSMRVTKQ